MLVCFLFLRQGCTPDYTESALLFTGAGLFITFAGYFLSQWSKKSRTFISILLLTLMVLLGKLVPRVMLLSWFIAGSGAAMYLAALIRESATKANLQNTLKSLAIATLLGIYLGAMVFSAKYHDAYFLEKVAFGQPFVMGTDTLFHSSLANMIANLGRITTGLDGTPFTPYYVVVHITFAQICKLMSQDCLPFFIFGYPLLVIPLFINSLCTLALQIIELSQSKLKSFSSSFYLTIASLTVGMLPPEGKVCNLSGPFIGESYGFGMIIAFSIMGLIVESFKKESEQKQPLIQKILLYLLLIPVMCAILTACKFSTAYLFFAICGYLFLRKKLFLDWVYVCSGLLSTLASYLVYKSLTFPYQLDMDIFGFYKDMSAIDVSLHVIFLYLPLWAIIALKVTVGKNNNLLQLLCESAIVFALACFIPSVFMNLAGGATSYFLEPQYFVSTILLVAFLGILGTLSNKKMTFVLSALLLIQTSIGLFRSGSAINESKKILASKPTPPDKILVITRLLELSKLPPRERSHSMVFIPQTCKSYWQMTIPITAPFIAPAITGMPMIDGLPPSDFTGTIYYSYVPYGFGVRRSKVQDESSATLKRNAALWGFQNIIRLDGPNLTVTTEKTSGI
jgi:hypothetical protein